MGGIHAKASRARAARGVLWAAAALSAGCYRSAPPSRFPDSRALIERVRRELQCSRGLGGEARFDYFGREGRVRAKALYVVSLPAKIRFDVLSPLGGVLSTLTSNGERFGFEDRQSRTFLAGEANACNLEQALRVPLPPEVLAQLLSGRPPVIVHAEGEASLSWERGAYRVTIDGEHAVRQTLTFSPEARDWQRPWQEQRVRLRSVEVEQGGAVWYQAELAGYEAAERAAPRHDPDGLEPDVPPSGPACDVALPRRIRFVVPSAGNDIVLEQGELHHNPPLVPGVFEPQAAPGSRVVRSRCGGAGDAAP